MCACPPYLSPLFSSQNITVIVAGEKATEAEGGGGIVRLRRPSLPPQFRVSARNVNIPLLSVVSDAPAPQCPKGANLGGRDVLIPRAIVVLISVKCSDG